MDRFSVSCYRACGYMVTVHGPNEVEVVKDPEVTRTETINLRGYYPEHQPNTPEVRTYSHRLDIHIEVISGSGTIFWISHDNSSLKPEESKFDKGNILHVLPHTTYWMEGQARLVLYEHKENKKTTVLLTPPSST